MPPCFKLVILAGLLFSAPAIAQASPWLPEPGTYKLFISAPVKRATRAFDKNGNASIKTDSIYAGVDIYAERGLTERFTLIGSLLAARQREEPEGGPRQIRYDLDVKLGLRRLLWRGAAWRIALDTRIGYKGRNYRTYNTNSDEFLISPNLHFGRTGKLFGKHAYDIIALSMTRYPDGESRNFASVSITSGVYPNPSVLAFMRLRQKFDIEGESDKRSRSLNLILGSHYFMREDIRITGEANYKIAGRNTKDTAEIKLGLGFFF